LEGFGNLGVRIRKPGILGSEIAQFPPGSELKAVEICAGAGGLALGITQAGFEHVAVVEIDKHSCETIRENQRSGHQLTKYWPLYEIDVRTFDYALIDSEVDLLSAGVPCQPFSLGGKGMAHRDPRDMFSEVVRAARELRPKAILIENVKGLLRPAFKCYFDYLKLALGSPSLIRREAQSWPDHFSYLDQRIPSGDVTYEVHVHSVNAADYGVPQWRDRVLIVAFRSDLKIAWSLPKSTHGADALVWSQWKTREYWKRHGLDREKPGTMSRRLASRVNALKEIEALDDLRLPWLTVRDAITDLPIPRLPSHSTETIPNHSLQPGARIYAGHTGSLMDEPAKALKAGDHGVPGGENALALGSRKIRYFSVRECARLQTFPDDYVFAGPWTSAMRQVGNAVPVMLGRTVAQSIRDSLQAAATTSTLLIPDRSGINSLRVRKAG
jgi:DNA (cytosine-5)-methyltransferase 1